jgi:hypothetical protein
LGKGDGIHKSFQTGLRFESSSLYLLFLQEMMSDDRSFSQEPWSGGAWQTKE